MVSGILLRTGYVASKQKSKFCLEAKSRTCSVHECTTLIHFKCHRVKYSYQMAKSLVSWTSIWWKMFHFICKQFWNITLTNFIKSGELCCFVCAGSSTKQKWSNVVCLHNQGRCVCNINHCFFVVVSIIIVIIRNYLYTDFPKPIGSIHKTVRRFLRVCVCVCLRNLCVNIGECYSKSTVICILGLHGRTQIQGKWIEK